MHPDYIRTASLVAASVAVGWTGWSGNALLLPAATFFPAIWSLNRTRWQAACVSAAYFLTASRGLPRGLANFYSADIWPGLALWLIASSAFVIVHGALWTKAEGWRRPVCYLAVCIVMALPPFGITGWAHPLTASGVLFPGWRWLGLVAMAACLCVMTTRHWFIGAIAITAFWLWSAVHWTVPELPASWQGVDLQLGASLGRDATLERQLALLSLVQLHPPQTTVLLPESAIGFWTPTVSRLWQAKLAQTGITVIAGAATLDQHGYDNVLVRISPAGSAILYRERMPVPGSMWQPWRAWTGQEGGARAHFFANPVVDLGGVRAAPLICYEQLILWPVLQSMLHDPDLIVAVGNGWWTAGTSIVEIQRASMLSWSRLFDKPLVLSFNT
jgi:hypothetical protein